MVRSVTDRTATVIEESLLLAFSADNVFTRSIESSTNLPDGKPIATVSEGKPRPGQFGYVDPEVGKNKIRFYRVVSTTPPQ